MLFGLRIPRLRAPLDIGQGQSVILLHGIGKSGAMWGPLAKLLPASTYRLIAFDLLGFGMSPKPKRSKYTIDDHADAVIAAIRRKRCKKPVVIVGHSLGALVALRVARRRPDVVAHVILYEMPLYDGLPEKRHYRARLAVYQAFYNWVLKQQPNFDSAKKQFREKLAKVVTGLELTPQTWHPFMLTLQNSILRQTAADDIKHLKARADVIYGSRDMVVIKGKVVDIFGSDHTQVAQHKVRASHRLNAAAAQLIAAQITLHSKQ